MNEFISNPVDCSTYTIPNKGKIVDIIQFGGSNEEITYEIKGSEINVIMPHFCTNPKLVEIIFE